MIGIIFLLLFYTKTAYASAFDIQKEIDAAQEGAVLFIPAGRYEGNFTIRKRITLQGEIGTELVGAGEKPAIEIEGVKGVTVENLSFTAKGKAIVASDVEGLVLRRLNIRDIHTGIYIHQAKDVQLQKLSVIGNNEHYSKKGNGIAIYKSEKVVVEDSTIQQVQDGIYIEEVDRIAITNNTVKNSRYGTHFMYTRDATVQQNVFSQNVTGLMMMMTEHLYVARNKLIYHHDLNGYGMLLFDVQHAQLEHNLITNNRMGVSLQKSKAIRIEQNDFQMNQTAIEGTKVDAETLVSANQFTGNILTARSDQSGFQLMENYYDDYTGMDLDGDGIGDTPYVAVSSFGQWMVRQPVYQYFVESPSVTLLRTIDTQINKSEKTVLVDLEPLMIRTQNEEKSKDQDEPQLLIGGLMLLSSIWLWRRGIR